ncbi:MAG: hypothetical protein HOO67_05115 [Candidatus Peribacteraceae bacterium]|nr:hypothetical protein [Candidatus Peribacteraceae bacterium]
MTHILHTLSSQMTLKHFVTGIVILMLPGVVFAQPSLIPASGTIGDCSFITGDFGFECIPLYLAYLIRLAFGLAGGFALFQIIQAGYEYALSGLPMGIVDKEAAKKRISHAIIGLVVVILAYLIIDTIVSAIFIG